MSKTSNKFHGFYPTHEKLLIEINRKFERDTHLMKRMPLDIMYRIFQNLPITDVENYCKNDIKGKEQCKWVFDEGHLVTRVAVDFNVWVMDSNGLSEIEDSETIIFRITWKSFNELKCKINAIKDFFGDNVFNFEIDNQENIKESSDEINEQTPFSDLLDIIWTVKVFSIIIEPNSENYDSSVELNDIRDTFRIDIEWPSGNFLDKQILECQIKMLLDLNQSTIENVLMNYEIPKKLTNKIKSFNTTNEEHLHHRFFQNNTFY